MQRKTAPSFCEHDIEPERIELVRVMPYQEYLLTHHDVDIVLDTFPCNGVTTTCHSLWMGVPVIVRSAGYRCVSRTGASILANMGLENLIAGSVREYRDIAVALATDTERLKCLRAGLRERMAQSPNTDGGAYTSEIEKIYREMWNEWCKSSSAP
jgi:predicted O-linked N-acetylglucosamine transferase (SPINDLY family)